MPPPADTSAYLQAPDRSEIKYLENSPLHGLALLAQHLSASLRVKWMQNVTLRVW